MAKTKSSAPRVRRSKIDLAAPVSQRVALESINLWKSGAQRKLKVDLSPTVSISVQVNTNVDKKEGVIEVFPRFVLVAKSGASSDDELLRIEALFLLRYRVPSFAGLRKANIAAFGDMNGLYNAWPYWREFVQATTVRMGLPALTIPVYRPVAAKASPRRTSSRRSIASSGAKKKRTVSAAK